MDRKQLWVNPANQVNPANPANPAHQANQAVEAGLNREVLRACLSQLQLWKRILSNVHAQTQKLQRKLDTFPETLTETAAGFCRTGPAPVSECDFEH